MAVIGSIQPEPKIELPRMSKTIRRMMNRHAGGTGKIHMGTVETRLTRAVYTRGLIAGRFGPGRAKAPVKYGLLGWWWLRGWQAGRADKGDKRYA